MIEKHVFVCVFDVCVCVCSEVTAVSVGDVQAAEDNVFTTTVTTSGSLPEHVLVGHTHTDAHTHTHSHAYTHTHTR